MMQLIDSIISIILSVITIAFCLGNYSPWWWLSLPVLFLTYFTLVLSIFWIYCMICAHKYRHHDFSGPVSKLQITNIRLIASFLMFLSLVTCKCNNKKLIPTDRPFLATFNHISDYDAWAIYKCISGRYAFVGKKILKQIKAISSLTVAGGTLLVDRNDPNSGHKMVDDAVNYITKQNTSVMIAPEGTRDMTGKLLPFKHGGFHIALRSKCPIVLIGLKGFEKLKHRHFLQIGHTSITIFGVIEPNEYENMTAGELADFVRNKYLAFLGQKDE